MTFDSKMEAMGYIMRYVMDEDRDEAEMELFDEEAGCGEYDTGSDQFTVITFAHAEERAQYWQNVADSIRADEKAPV